MGFVVWFFTETVYGLVALSVPFYGIGVILKRVSPKFPQPFAIAVIAFVVLISTLPSYARFQFEKRTLERYNKSSGYHLVNSARWGDLAEPLTWFVVPIGFFHFVKPDPVTYQHGIGGMFSSVILRYEEAPIIQVVGIECGDNTIAVSEPDGEGVFRYTQRFNAQMTQEEFSIYCTNNFHESD